jgi:hypothetical protein
MILQKYQKCIFKEVNLTVVSFQSASREKEIREDSVGIGINLRKER